MLTHLVASASPVDARYLWRPKPPDEGDNFVMEIAIAASPCSIVMHKLRDFVNAVLTPGQFLSRLSNQENSHLVPVPFARY